MLKGFFSLLLATLLLAAPAAAQQQDDYIGTWEVKDKGIKVKIFKAGDHCLFQFEQPRKGEVYPLIKRDGMFAMFAGSGEERVLLVPKGLGDEPVLLFRGLRLTKAAAQ